MTRVFLSILAVALVMGPGPGMYLVNDLARDGHSVAGIPVLYAWAVFWFGVMAVCVLGLHRLVWTRENDDREDGDGR